MDSLWAAIKPDWHDQARCSGADSSLFYPADESPAALASVRTTFCDQCPVRDKCLNSALINHDSGFWGGTSTEMRRAMIRNRSRIKCPVCSGAQLVIQNAYEICVRCGASWRAGHRPVSIEIIELPIGEPTCHVNDLGRTDRSHGELAEPAGDQTSPVG